MPGLPMGEVGAANIVWDPNGDNISFKSQFGTVEFSGQDTVVPIQEERFGDAPVSASFGGMVVQLTVPVTRTELAKLKFLLHGDITGDELTLVNKAGCEADPKPIFIQTMCGGEPEVDRAKWWNVFAAYAFRAFTVPYDRNTQRIIEAVFHCFVSTESGTMDQFGTLGVN